MPSLYFNSNHANKGFTLLELMVGLAISSIIILGLITLQAHLLKVEYYKYATSEQYNTLVKLQNLLQDRYQRAIFSPKCASALQLTSSQYLYDKSLKPDATSILKQAIDYPIQGVGYFGDSGLDVNTDQWPIADKNDFTQAIPKSIGSHTSLKHSDYLQMTTLTWLPINTLKNALTMHLNYFSIPKESDLSASASDVYFIATDCNKSIVFSTKRERIGNNTRFYLERSQHELLDILNPNEIQIYQMHLDVLGVTKDLKDSRPYFRLHEYGNTRSLIKIPNIENIQFFYHIKPENGWKDAQYIKGGFRTSDINGLMITPLISKKTVPSSQRIVPAPKINGNPIGHAMTVSSKTHEFIRPVIILALHNRIF